MKPVFFVVVFLFAGYWLQAQYVVTKVTGNARLKSSGESLHPGMRLADLDGIAFGTPEANVRVLAAGKGVYVLTPNPQTIGRFEAVVDLVKTTLKIKAREGTLSGRGAADEKIPEVFENEPTVNSRTLIQPESKFLFDQKKYPVVAGGRFFLQVEASGAAATARPLLVNGDTLLITPADFTAGAAADIHYTLGFYNKISGTSESITPLYPYLDTRAETEGIIGAMKTGLPGVSADSLRAASYREVYTALGKPSPQTFDLVFRRVTRP